MERLAANHLQPAGAPAIDLSVPPGAAALVAPTSISWRAFKNPVTLFIGGVAAVLLELAEPRVRHGVWDHSTFRTRPLERLQRTGLAAMMTVYGPAEQARAVIERVNRLHAQVSGVTSGGAPYRADDPELLTWVQATAAFGFLEAGARFAQPIGLAERDAFYAEAGPIAHLYGANGAPCSVEEQEALFARVRPSLVPSSTLPEFLGIMTRVEALPILARPLQAILLRAAVDILPPGLARQIGIGPEWRLRGWEAALVTQLASLGERLVIRSWPSVQACRRLGLPDDFLYAR